MDKSQVIDYLTSFIFFLVVAMVAYQPYILQEIPQEYNLLALIIFAVLSQFTADKRVKEKVHEINTGIDFYQKKINKLQERIEMLQAKSVDKIEE